MWYKKDTQDHIKLDKPIIVTLFSGDNCILLPQIAKDDYKVIGYNWFNITEGEYNSCCLFPTVKAAIESYQSSGHSVGNKIIVLEEPLA
jgi:hypothetical protein